jgi:hypothetical protein
MKRNVVTRETAKKLKAAGFPGVPMWHYSEGMIPPDELFFYAVQRVNAVRYRRSYCSGNCRPVAGLLVCGEQQSHVELSRRLPQQHRQSKRGRRYHG